MGRRGGFGPGGLGLFGLTSTNDGTVVSNDPFSVAAFSQQVDTSALLFADNTFADMVLTFTTGGVAPSGNIRLFVKHVDPDSTDRLHVDNFRLDATAVPEPAALGLLALTGGVLMRRRRC